MLVFRKETEKKHFQYFSRAISIGFFGLLYYLVFYVFFHKRHDKVTHSFFVKLNACFVYSIFISWDHYKCKAKWEHNTGYSVLCNWKKKFSLTQLKMENKYTNEQSRFWQLVCWCTWFFEKDLKQIQSKPNDIKISVFCFPSNFCERIVSFEPNMKLSNCCINVWLSHFIFWKK